jgi:branched-chain amino acid transport system substrate-binding protein
MSISRRAFVAGAAAAGAYSLASAFPCPALAANIPVRIGILRATKGSSATSGECALRATRWAVEKVNKAGGIAGRKVELVIEEESTPQGTAERFRVLAGQKVDCVQGLVSTGNCLSVAPVAEEVRQLFMSWDGTTQNGVKDTMPDAKYVFKSTDNECEAVMASLLAVKYYKGKFKKIAGLNPDYSYGKNNWEAFKQILTRYGIEFEVVADHWVKVGFSPADLAPHIDALKKAKPDLIYSSILFADQGTLMKAAHTAGLTKHTKFVLPGGPSDINVLKKETVPEKTILGLNTLYFAYSKASPLQREFVHYYFDRYKTAPFSEADRGYFAFAAYKAGVERAYKATGRWPSQEDVAAAIPGIEIQSLGGPGRYRQDKIAEQMFYQGLTTNKNAKYAFPTLSKVEVLPATALQKPSGEDFWDWIKTAPMVI